MQIQYIPSPTGGGYQVRVREGVNRTSRYFSVRKYGDKALDRAVHHGRQLEQRARRIYKPAVRTPRYADRQTRGKMTRANRSGVVGLRLRWWYSADGTPAPYIQANWTDDDGIVRCCTYSVEYNGIEGAVARALQKRARMRIPVPAVSQAVKTLAKSYPEARILS